MNLNFDSQKALSAIESRMAGNNVPVEIVNESQVRTLKSIIGAVIEKFTVRMDMLERLILSGRVKGDKGDQGLPGIDGKDGVSIRGRDGKNGKDGKNGIDGKDGISVVSSYIAADGNLVLVLSNGNEIDAGNLDMQSRNGTNVFNTHLANQQITVSTTAPANPSINDLWLDIT